MLSGGFEVEGTTRIFGLLGVHGLPGCFSFLGFFAAAAGAPELTDRVPPHPFGFGERATEEFETFEVVFEEIEEATTLEQLIVQAVHGLKVVPGALNLCSEKAFFERFWIVGGGDRLCGLLWRYDGGGCRGHVSLFPPSTYQRFSN